MTTKEKVLEFFEQNRGVFFSGEAIANSLGVSRTSIWKAIKGLQEAGYKIKACTNRGYCLLNSTDIISSQGIKKYLENNKVQDIVVLPTIISTNFLAKQDAENGVNEGKTIIANEQTQGKGRWGHSFFSPKDSGVYLSIILRPKAYLLQNASSITTMAAVAVCEAIEEVSGYEAKIKWVNDIFVHNKKVCGILTEGSYFLENNSLNYIILGVGINIYNPKNNFPKELQQIAGSIFSEPQNDIKNKLVATFLNKFFSYYQTKKDYIDAYKRRNFIIGKTVHLNYGKEKEVVKILDIDSNCRLLIQNKKQEKRWCSYGKVTIAL